MPEKTATPPANGTGEAARMGDAEQSTTQNSAVRPTTGEIPGERGIRVLVSSPTVTPAWPGVHNARAGADYTF
jgi:hypothetical protein